MSYTPTTWSAGDTVTSAKLNKMEQGIANAGGANILVAHWTMNEEGSSIPGRGGIKALRSNSVPDNTLDVTLRQIMNADFTIVQMNFGEGGIEYGNVSEIYYDSEENFYSITIDGYNRSHFYAESEDDYPALDTGSNSD